jgi:hypothetical protein
VLLVMRWMGVLRRRVERRGFRRDVSWWGFVCSMWRYGGVRCCVIDMEYACSALLQVPMVLFHTVFPTTYLWLGPNKHRLSHLILATRIAKLCARKPSKATQEQARHAT